VSRSDLEERFLDVCAARGIARPRVNAVVAGLEVDFLFAAERLVVETDGYRHHRTRRSFERDRTRDAILTAAGYRALRFTHRQLTEDPGMVAAALRVALRPGRPSG
jgi:very-short-patch-repair endonuclease